MAEEEADVYEAIGDMYHVQRDTWDRIQSKNLIELTSDEMAFINLNGSDFIGIKDGVVYAGIPLVVGEIRLRIQLRSATPAYAA